MTSGVRLDGIGYQFGSFCIHTLKIVQTIFVIFLIFHLAFGSADEIYTWDMCKASTNGDWNKNIVEATFEDAANFRHECSTDYIPESESNYCSPSNYGIYFNKGASADAYDFMSIFISSLRFRDHSTYTIQVRSYLNPSKVTFNANGVFTMMAFCQTSASCFQMGIGLKYFSGIPGSCQPFGILEKNLNKLIDSVESTAPIINTASWIDFSLTATNQGAASKYQLTFKAYSQELVFDSGSINAGQIVPWDTSTTDTFASNLFNWKAMDMTIQYYTVLKGSKTYEYIGESYGTTPPEGLMVPPEYCSDASSSFLLNACTNKIGKKCKAIDACKCNEKSYTNKLATKQIAGIAIGVSLAVDIIIGLILFICSLA